MSNTAVAGTTITIDGKAYEVESLSEQARAQVKNLRFTDAEIERTKAQLAVLKTARMAYANALKDQLSKAELQ